MREDGWDYIVFAMWHDEASGRPSRDIDARISDVWSGSRGWRNYKMFTVRHAEPEIRMTAMAAFPEAVDSAYIVGSSWLNLGA